MNDSSGLMSQDEASPPHEQLGACLKNLFSIPSKNVELAFQLILGMIREQSSQIECLKQANAEALESNAMVCSSMQNAIDNLTRENHELSGDFEVVKRHHHEILKSHSEAMHAVAGLRNDFEVSSNVFLFFRDKYVILMSLEKYLLSEDADIQLLRRNC